MNVIQTSGDPIGQGDEEQSTLIDAANVTTVEDVISGERQIIQVIRSDSIGRERGEMAIATAAKIEDHIYEFGAQPQYIAIPNNALSNVQVHTLLRNDLDMLSH